MRFCSPGTFSSGISTPRSPRATISASEISMISSSRAMACGFSILDMTSARPAAVLRTSATSSGRCTKESATQSMPASSAASRSERSFGRHGGDGDLGVGQAHALAVGDLARHLDARHGALGRRLRDDEADLAVVDEDAVAGLQRPQDLGMRQVHAVGVARRLAGIEHEALRPSPASPTPSLKASTRSLGPCRSTRMPMGRPNCFSTARMVATRSRIMSWVEWDMLMRNTSAPASNRRAMVAWSEEAGPSVARIFTRRRRLITSSGGRVK